MKRDFDDDNSHEMNAMPAAELREALHFLFDTENEAHELVAELADATDDPQVRSALVKIAREKRRHAETLRRLSEGFATSAHGTDYPIADAV